MRLALVSDQHANDVAFRAVVDDIERVGVDAVVCLGDVAQGGTQPRETLHRLRRLGCRTVLGNSDAFLLDAELETTEAITERQLEVREWTLAQLDDDDLALVRSFEPTVDFDLGGVRVLCFHGSPRSYDDILMPEWEGATLEPFRGFDADVLAGGHTHRQWSRTIDGALFVNPGSVGLAYDHHQAGEELRVDAVAEYAVVYADDLGASVDFRRVAYSAQDAAAAAVASGRPYVDEWVGQWR